MEKVCTKCQRLKNLDLFPVKKKSKDGRAPWCRDCFKANWRKRYYERHEDYRNKHNQSRNKIRLENARKVFEYLNRNNCVNCGESDPVVLEFDHRDRSEKVESISNLIRNSSWERIKSEIERCNVLCANCHRRKTAEDFKYRRLIFVNL